MKGILATIFAAMLATAGLSAQNYQLPDRHSARHDNLLANQGNAGILVENTTRYLQEIFEEEEEPEFDIYTEGWDSKRVNCYTGVSVPQKVDIDVSKFSMPHPGYITSPYGYRKRFRRMHKGVDLKINMGDTIRAAFDGRVRITNYERAGYGYYVVVRHTNDLETVYGHLSGFIVEEGQYVKAGDPIALGGNTGRSTGPHLHFETRYMGYAINPCAIFDFANQTTHTDTYTFDKRTYQQARNFSVAANQAYANEYRKKNPPKPYVKSTSGATTRTASSSYRIRKGDTLSKIASRNGTTVAKLCALNGLKTTSKLSVGQRIKLR